MTTNLVVNLEETTKLCQLLMKTPHYAKMGQEGIFAIVQKAKAVGVEPLEALNGGMYFVQGKVEMTAGMMNDLIRRAGHSITKDKTSNETICILHGKRKDTGDTWCESFSIEDAQKAGIYRNQWLKYPKDMLFARALSRLARQLFPDVIKGAYVEGEISQAINQESEPTLEVKPITIEDGEKMISDQFPTLPQPHRLREYILFICSKVSKSLDELIQTWFQNPETFVTHYTKWCDKNSIDLKVS